MYSEDIIFYVKKVSCSLKRSIKIFLEFSAVTIRLTSYGYMVIENSLPQGSKNLVLRLMFINYYLCETLQNI